MKRCISIFLVLFILFGQSAFALDFTINSNLTTSKQSYYKEKVDTVFKVFEDNLSKIPQEEQSKKLTQTITKIDIIFQKRVSERNYFILSYLKFLLQNKLNGTSEDADLWNLLSNILSIKPEDKATPSINKDLPLPTIANTQNNILTWTTTSATVTTPIIVPTPTQTTVPMKVSGLKNTNNTVSWNPNWSNKFLVWITYDNLGTYSKIVEWTSINVSSYLKTWNNSICVYWDEKMWTESSCIDIRKTTKIEWLKIDWNKIVWNTWWLEKYFIWITYENGVTYSTPVTTNSYSIDSLKGWNTSFCIYTEEDMTALPTCINVFK